MEMTQSLWKSSCDLEGTKSSGNVKNPDIRLKLCNPYWTFPDLLVPENHPK